MYRVSLLMELGCLGLHIDVSLPWDSLCQHAPTQVHSSIDYCHVHIGVISSVVLLFVCFSISTYPYCSCLCHAYLCFVETRDYGTKIQSQIEGEETNGFEIIILMYFTLYGILKCIGPFQCYSVYNDFLFTYL